MICKVCEKNFIPKNKQHIYCSPRCRNNHRVRDQDKMREYKTIYRLKTKDKMREYHLKKTFGLDLEQYANILSHQDGGCGVCGRTPEEEGRNLAVDHDHRTGEIFGLLCWFCNHKLIGKNRNPVLYEKVANFLSKGTGLFVPEGMKTGRKKRKKKNG